MSLTDNAIIARAYGPLRLTVHLDALDLRRLPDVSSLAFSQTRTRQTWAHVRLPGHVGREYVGKVSPVPPGMFGPLRFWL